MYAKWEINSYSLTFNPNNGDQIQNYNVIYDTNLTFNEIFRVGYSFSGWYEDESLSIAFANQTMPARNTNLYAKWNINSYTISFESNGGSTVGSITQEYLSEVIEPMNPTRTGYTFEGWYTNTSLTNKYTFGTMGSSNITLYAKWTVNQYTITYNTNGGDTLTQHSVSFGATVTLKTASRAGYSFSGWYEDESLSIAFTNQTMPAKT